MDTLARHKPLMNTRDGIQLIAKGPHLYHGTHIRDFIRSFKSNNITFFFFIFSTITCYELLKDIIHSFCYFFFFVLIHNIDS